VDDVRREFQALAAVERGSLQHQEPQMLVGSDRVDRRSIVDGRAVHEVQRHGGAGQTRLVQRVLIEMCAEPQVDVLRAVDRHHLQRRGADARVQRHDHANVVTQVVQMTRQHAGDVGEAAGLRERRHLGSDEADAHGGRNYLLSASFRAASAPSCSWMKVSTLFSR
jgi:hypothetical protein